MPLSCFLLCNTCVCLSVVCLLHKDVSFCSLFYLLSLEHVQFSCSVVSDSLWPHGLKHTRLPCPSLTSGACSNSCPSSQWCHPNISSCFPLLLLPSIFSSIRVFSSKLALRIGWPKYWSFSFSFSISPSNEYSGLISFRIDWFDLLAVQGTLKSLLQHHSSKASVLWCSAFFMIQFSHPSMTTGKTIALTRWTFVGKVMSLLFKMLSRLVIAYLLRSKHLLISRMWSLSAMILEPTKIKSDTVSTFYPSICQKVMGLDAMISVFWMLNFKPAFSLSSFTLITSTPLKVITRKQMYFPVLCNASVLLIYCILCTSSVLIPYLQFAPPPSSLYW